jgi:DNA-binding response OmpR family regulator
MPNRKRTPLTGRETQTIESLKNRVRELEEILGATIEFPSTLELTPSEGALLGILLNREIVPPAAAFAILYGSQAGGEPSDPKNVVSVLIMRLRKKLAAHGVDIKTRSGAGYYMTVKAKDQLRSIIEREA